MARYFNPDYVLVRVTTYDADLVRVSTHLVRWLPTDRIPDNVVDGAGGLVVFERV